MMLKLGERRAVGGEKKVSVDSSTSSSSSSGRLATTMMKRGGGGGGGEAELSNHHQLPSATSYLSLHHQNHQRHQNRNQSQNLHHHHHHQSRVPPSPLRSSPEYSPSSASFSTRSCSSDDASSPYLHHHSSAGHYLDGLSLDHHNKFPCNESHPEINANKMVDELGLSQKFYKLNVRDQQPGLPTATKLKGGFEIDTDPNGFGSRDGFNLGGNAGPYNTENYGVLYGGFNNGGGSSFEPSSPGGGVSFSFDGTGNKYAFADFNGGYPSGVYDSMGSLVARNQFSDLIQGGYTDGDWSNREIPLPPPTNPSPTRLGDAIAWSKQHAMNPNGYYSSLSSKVPELVQSKMDACRKRLMLTEWARAMANNGGRQPFTMGSAADVDAFGSDDRGLIVQGKSFNQSRNYTNKARGDSRRSSRKSSITATENLCSFHGGAGVYENGHQRPSDYSLLPPLSSFPGVDSPFCQVQGHVYLMAKDQNGCRFLQRIFDEGTSRDVVMIFDEIVDHVVELSLNQFGNYVIQKMLDVCDEEQRLQIVFVLTKEPGQLVKISLNTYGTRVVQKLVETLNTRHQISLVVLALKSGLRDVVEDQNGNHVVQSCLKYLSNDDNKFIFDAASKFCVEIGTHQHGCCVMQKCIDHFKGKYLDKLVSEIAKHALLLSQDPFGNYVVQHVIEQEKPAITAKLLPQFEGHFVQLSMQKCSSNVVERCLKHSEESRPKIIHELLSVSHFDQLLQDPFANYVIQTALIFTKGPLHSLLVDAIRPHSRLRTSPYCKRIFTRNMLKK
ncbi:unnamed protein product [Linum tenue]|uniref:PUM-HD domain-containing protein n=1 Tax=Linum tenue TaxID=586396 RepID=A0AAV0MNJ3_9ROSI|nr:unnamed protein product [Linum tenue]